MAQTVLIDGNEAIARGAICAGCRAFFGYPITPQSEVGEYMSRELPKVGGVFVQSESESAAIYMLFGGVLAGERTMTSTSSPGFSLMQEGISWMAEDEMPAVIVEVMRAGPGIGTGGQQGQTDYRQITKGGGHGAYRCIVLAPYSVQESFDLIQFAFHLADKYRITVIVASDFIVARMAEMVELRTLSFEPLPEKEWALKGKSRKGGRHTIIMGGAFGHGGPQRYYPHMMEKYQQIVDSEVRYDTYKTEDAEFLLIAYGSSARMAEEVVDMARDEGIEAGLFRPITLWPFPEEAVRETACRIGKVLVVEDSPGELVEDVKFAVEPPGPVHLLGIWARHVPLGPGYWGGGSGIIYPERILEEVKKLI